MSSHYTTVSCEEWEQLQNTIKATDAYQIRSQEEIARLDAIMAQNIAEMEKMRQETKRAIDAAQDYLILTYQNASSNLGAQFRSQINRNTETFDVQLKEMRNAAANLSTRTSAASGAIDRLADDFSKAVSALLDGQSHEERRAKRTLEELNQLLDKLRGLNPSGQTLTALQSMETVRAAAAGNIAGGDYQAALIVTQGSILTASRALATAIVEREHYNSELAKVQSAFSDLQSQTAALSSKEGIISYDIGADTYECEYDLNFWSHGLFEEIQKQVSALGVSLQNAASAPASLNHLHDLASRIQTLQAQLEKCDLEARRDLAGTLALENMVQRLYAGLEERGWSIESSGHQDDDARKPYTMTCTDGAGNTVSIVGAGGERPEMPSFFYEAFSDDEGMADLVKQSVTATLQTEGINIESDVERDDCGSVTSPDSFVERISCEAAQTASHRRRSVRLEVNSAR